MKTIIAATDFSDNAGFATDYAADMAAVAGCNLLLLHVCALPVSYGEVADRYINTGEEVKQAEIRIGREQERIETRIGQVIKVSTAVLQGSVADGIRQACAGHDVYAVVMGQNRYSSFERFLLGNHVAAAMHQLPWPLMVIPPGTQFKGLRNIGLACDLTEVIDSLPVAEIKAIVRRFGAQLHILHVKPSVRPTAFAPAVIEESAWLQDLLSDLQPVYHFVEGDDTEQSIIDFADREHLDLLMVIPRKHHLLGRLFHQSHSKKLVLHTHVPVMAVHEPG